MYVYRIVILRMRNLGENGPLRRNNVCEVARIGSTLFLPQMGYNYTLLPKEFGDMRDEW